MIDPKKFTETLVNEGVDFFCGVPDSLLKDFCAYIEESLPEKNHIVSANEGTAIAIAAGKQMATGKTPMVYLQNSGFGNIINPLLSLADKDVYSIPILILMGWRGEPGSIDEPQHIKQGKVTIPLLEAIKIPYFILDEDEYKTNKSIKSSLELISQINSPVVLLAKKGIFKKYQKKNSKKENYLNLISREEAIKQIILSFAEDTIFIASTGYISRELYEIRSKLNQKHDCDFLTVGSMGHSSQIALGIALSKKDKKIVCLDGDGAMIMHLGGLVTNGINGTENLFHIILNNSVHDSVGGQPTAGFKIKATTIAKGCRYSNVYGPIFDSQEIKNTINKMKKDKGPNFLEIRIKPGARSDLGRPKEKPIHNKEIFISKLES